MVGLCMVGMSVGLVMRCAAVQTERWRAGGGGNDFTLGCRVRAAWLTAGDARSPVKLIGRGDCSRVLFGQAVCVA